ncbi:partial Transcriptional regulatory protein DegU, partial [Anaerolineae bacterium]
MSKIRILLVDDHTILREGLRAFLRYHADMEIVGEARNGVEAAALVKQLRPDVILMDIAMPEMNGIEATRLICEKYPATKILILTQHEDPQYILQLLQVGASGYVLKDVLGIDLVAAVRTVARGESFLSPSVAKMLAQELRQTGNSKSSLPESLT